MVVTVSVAIDWGSPGVISSNVDKNQISNFGFSSLPILIQTIVYIQTNFGHAGKKSICQVTS